MRTITKQSMKRLIAQRDEAKLLGLEKVASQLTDQIAINNTREASEGYVYNYSDLKKEVEDSLWDAAIRAQDFYGKIADAREIQDVIEKQAQDFINSIKNKTGSVIGAYESSLPGESDEVLEVREDE